MLRRVKIYATDIDDAALTKARQATYSAKEVSGVPPELLAKYFERNGAGHTVAKQMRRAVIFGRHDLFADAPISKIDLLFCRNTLMYFNADAQARILANLHFSLADSGALVLGKAEMLLAHNALFTPLDLKRRIFGKIPHAYLRLRNGNGGSNHGKQPIDPADFDQVRLREAAFEVSSAAQLGFDVDAVLVIANEAARRGLGLLSVDVGRHARDISANRRLPSLSDGVERVLEAQRSLRTECIEWRRPGEDSLYYDLDFQVVWNSQNAVSGVTVSLLDVTADSESPSPSDQALPMAKS